MTVVWLALAGVKSLPSVMPISRKNQWALGGGSRDGELHRSVKPTPSGARWFKSIPLHYTQRSSPQGRFAIIPLCLHLAHANAQARERYLTILGIRTAGLTQGG